MNLIKSKLNIILILVLVLILTGGVIAYQKFVVKGQAQAFEEIDLTFDPEGPYALLYPRRDGNALILNIKRTASFEEFAYQVTYSDEEGIDRGAGFLETWIKLSKDKGEYEQEILFGTCSRNVCKYDKGVENGTLTLRLKKGNKVYKTSSLWHLQKPDVALGALSSGDGHLNYKIASGSADLSLLKYTIINDLSGAPKLPSGKTVLGKVYAVNSPESKTLPSASVTIELAEDASSESKIARFDEVKARWIEYETKVSGSTLTALVDSGGVLAVLVPNK